MIRLSNERFRHASLGVYYFLLSLVNFMPRYRIKRAKAPASSVEYILVCSTCSTPAALGDRYKWVAEARAFLLPGQGLLVVCAEEICIHLIRLYLNSQIEAQIV